MAEQLTDTAGVHRTADPTVLAYRRSPGHDLAALMSEKSSEQVRLREVPFLTQIAIRAVSADAVRAVGDALGAPLPTKVGDVSAGERDQGNPVDVVWLAPDEWLAVLGDEADTGESAASVVISLAAALEGHRGQVVDVSANRTTLELSGPRARAVLDKTIELDLHPREFAVGRAVATAMERVPVICWRTAADTWLLMPRSSFAEHVVRWLIDGMEEFG